MVFRLFFGQDALSAELNNLGMNYGKELMEKPPVTSNDQKNQSSQTFVDQEQFLRWVKFLHSTYDMFRSSYFVLQIREMNFITTDTDENLNYFLST